MEAKQQALAERSSPMEKMNYRNQEKKKQLTSDQLKARKQFVNQMRLQLALNSFTCIQK